MYAGSFAIPYDALDIGLRLIAATLIGMALGLERMLRGKPTGMRTPAARTEYLRTNARAAVKLDPSLAPADVAADRILSTDDVFSRPMLRSRA